MEFREGEQFPQSSGSVEPGLETRPADLASLCQLLLSSLASQPPAPSPWLWRSPSQTPPPNPFHPCRQPVPTEPLSE